VRNVHLDATEHGERLIFMHTVREGPAKMSYGLQVAALAGVPPAVIRRARGYLRELEQGRATAPGPQAELPLFAAVAEPNALQARLEAIDPDSLTPREAHDILYELKLLSDGTGDS
jgi:DNA mismatch repair protein MutS